MTGVENVFIYRPGSNFQQIYRMRKPPGCVSPVNLDRVYLEDFFVFPILFNQQPRIILELFAIWNQCMLRYV